MTNAPGLALYTFGIFRRPSADPANAGFHARNEPNLAAAEAAAGFIARSGYDGDPGPASWGPHAYPRFYRGGDAHSPSTLSLWDSLEAPMAFTYHGIHAEALAHGRDWFLKPVPPPARPAWPPYVLWWVAGDHRPHWQEAVARHEHLHDHGASSQAFDWQTPLDAAGRPAMIDRARVRQLAARNATPA
ncbi:DUF3291 domain-containing protein [Ferrovibrio xuzhouensis]|uniref:DUF3291 domain-containing protein n=1 Tax=Ferrovibrio xuzhouensis TaxID=1576914 RepID=A0ABV7VC01_9PROT